MQWRILALLSAFGLISLPLVAQSEKGQQSLKLPFKFQKGDDHVFRVEMDLKAIEASASGQAGQSGQTEQQREKQEREKQQQEQQREKSGQGGRFEVPATGRASFDYLIEVRDMQGQNATLDVYCEHREKLEGTAAQRESEEQEAKKRIKSAKDVKKFTVQVDQNGRVTQVQGLENVTGSPDPGKSAEGSPQRQQAMDAALSESFIRSQIHLILGTGLHNQELQVGKFYSPSMGGAQAGAQVGGQFGQAAGQAGKGRHAQAISKVADILDQVQLRFDGQSEEGREKVARFTVFAPPAGGSSSQSEEKQKEQQQGKSGQGNVPPGWKQAGTANYEIDDGWVHRFVAHGLFGGHSNQGGASGQAGGQAGGQGAQVGGQFGGGENVWFQIRRIGSD